MRILKNAISIEPICRIGPDPIAGHFPGGQDLDDLYFLRKGKLLKSFWGSSIIEERRSNGFLQELKMQGIELEDIDIFSIGAKAKRIGIRCDKPVLPGDLNAEVLVDQGKIGSVPADAGGK